MTNKEKTSFIAALKQFTAAATNLSYVWSEVDMTDSEVDITAGIPVGMSFDEFALEQSTYTEEVISKLNADKSEL